MNIYILINLLDFCVWIGKVINMDTLEICPLINWNYESIMILKIDIKIYEFLFRINLWHQCQCYTKTNVF